MASLQIAPLPARETATLAPASFAGAPEGLLRALARAVLEAREEEARRIARELHDDAGQLVASAFLALDEVERSLPEGARSRLGEARGALSRVENHLRRLAHELRPSALDDLGLAAAVEYLAKGVATRTGIDVTVIGGTGGRLPSRVETAAYRIVQEALCNAARHASPARIDIRLEVSAGRLAVVVRDDGRGFVPVAALRRTGRRGLGFIGMLERLGALGGTLRLRSTPGRGTEIRAEIPFEKGWPGDT